MIDTFRSIFKVEELRKRIFFTLGLLVVYRVGGHIPTPGVDGSVLAQFLSSQQSIFGLLDLFAGGAFAKATIFAMGIMPYISASIMLQLLGAVIPYLQRLQREGEEGRRKITQWTRYLTVLIAAAQAYGTAAFLMNVDYNGIKAVHMAAIYFIPLTIITFTTGTIFIMWLGEQITERGIGNGISLIIFIGIIARFPEAIITEIQFLWGGTRAFWLEIMMVAAMLIVVAAIILMTRAQRRIPVQYPRKVVGRRVFGGATTHLPLSINSAGVIPIIFAQSIMFLPSTVAQFFPDTDWIQNLVAVTLAPGALWYNIIYGLIIVFFAYFYTAIVFNPVEIADNMRKNGGYIPGIRPGKNTADYIDRILTRITLPGALFFAMIAILPWVLISWAGVNFYFGGTGLLIVVGVALDTLQQIESHLLMRHYDGFMKKGRIRGRSM
ncbi:preprotein translocase subunit SecY [candidate division GN15 bacterium]|uniref:Protein translocase subunit SecY n=1 Tax=candidate division GN15 bacterium TaxID=2072418 RepID=A0A855X1S6_9BACT|nr:MAG: preprotein translocase subunit SecY [candidate division GN15 bacterium]